jgi:hypothetical protein
MPPAGLKPAITANERPQNHAFNCTATEIGIFLIIIRRTIFSTKYNFPAPAFSDQYL